MSFQFRSYAEPLIVMAAVPLALVGVIWGHVLMRYPLTMPSILGFASLSGIVVNDSILLVIPCLYVILDDFGLVERLESFSTSETE